MNNNVFERYTKIKHGFRRSATKRNKMRSIFTTYVRNFEK